MTDQPPSSPGAIRKQGLAAALWTLAHALVFFLLCAPAFETCDDVFLMDMASGRFTGRPEAQLFYTNVTLGFALKTLYQISQGVGWYGLTIVGAQLAGWHLIARGALALAPERRTLLVLSAAFAVLGLPLLMELQYTATALFLGCAAAFSYAARQRENWARGPALSAGAGLVFAGLIRAQSLHAALVFSLPLALVFLMRKRPLKQDLIWLAATLALHGATLGLQSLALRSDPEWARFAALEDTMWNLAGRPPMPVEKRGALAPIGWSSNDLEMVYSFYYADRDVVSLEAAGAALEVARKNRRRIKSSRRRKAVRRILTRGHGLELWAIIALAAAFLPGLTAGRLLQLAFAGAWFYGVALLIDARYERLPERVLRPALLSPLLAAMLITELRAGSFNPAAWPARSRRSLSLLGLVRLSFAIAPPGWLRRGLTLVESAWRPALLALALGLAGQQWGYAVLHSDTNRAHRRGYQADMARLKAFDEDGVFAMWGPTGHFRVGPFAAPASQVDVAVLRVTWPAQSPHWQADMARRGLTHLTRGIIERADVYLVAAPDQLALFTVYAKERFGLDIEARPVSLVSRCFVSLKGEHFQYCNCVLPVYAIGEKKPS